jgi:site-specific recombinase XerD
MNNVNSSTTSNQPKTENDIEFKAKAVNGRILVQRSLDRLKGAYAESTLRAYRADFEVFITWCESVGVEALPATPEAIVTFIIADAAASKSATVRRRIAAIGRIHRLNRLVDPTKSEEVLLGMRRMHRQKGRRQKQALGLTINLMEQMLAVTGDDVKGLRDRVLLRLGYDTLRRRSELVQLLIEDITTRPDGSGLVLLRFSKTDQEGEGKKIPLSKETVAACQAWLGKVQQTTGPILRKSRGSVLLATDLLMEAYRGFTRRWRDEPVYLKRSSMDSLAIPDVWAQHKTC